MCWNTSRSHGREKRNVSVRSGSMNGSRYSSSRSASTSMAGPDEPGLAQPLERALGVAVDGEGEELAHLRRQPVGEPLDGAEVHDPEAAVGHEAEVAGMGVGVEQADAGGAGEEELHVALGGGVALLCACRRR